MRRNECTGMRSASLLFALLLTMLCFLAFFALHLLYFHHSPNQSPQLHHHLYEADVPSSFYTA